jgi:Tol biopolymer transport system component/catechol 2,3-dioxygenase-like lactoylglutathione lyase family enzyme
MLQTFLPKTLGFLLLLGACHGAAQSIGVFDNHTDIGGSPVAGSAEFDAASGEYKVTGAGSNIWGYADAFQYVWKRVSGDVSISADVRFDGPGKAPHRKVVLMIRQNLDPASPHAAATEYADGLTALQFRGISGAVTLELRTRQLHVMHLRLERRDHQLTMYYGNPGEEPKQLGPAVVIMQDPIYVGLGVCSRDPKTLETAIFSNVKIETAASRPRTRSKITVYSLQDKSSKVIYTEDKVFEAPNWSPDGKYLLVNSGGSLYKLAVDSPDPKPEKMDSRGIVGINNDHGISPDGKQIALSARISGAPASQVYLIGSDGSNPRLMTKNSPSYYHGWSPDGKWLAYCAQRDGNFDIYRVPVSGGEEERLTSSPGYDDGPDYSPDGKWIYINSDRTGQFQIWRFPAEGAGPGDAKAQRVTNDEFEDWFPHPSPDGKWMVFVSFPKGTKGHPANQNVRLRMMPLPGAVLQAAKTEVIAELFGGQGTINVNSWSPDSQRFAYVSYELLPPLPLAAVPAGPDRPLIKGLAHVAFYAHDVEKTRAFYHDFLGFEEPYSLKNPDGSLSMAFVKINDQQYIELSPEKEPGTDRLNHIALLTNDAEAMRQYLAAKGVKVPDHVDKGRIGNSNFMIADPEGHAIEIVQYEPSGQTMAARGKYLPRSRISQYMMHAGLNVTNPDAEMKFYGDVLGFQEIWRGSKDGKVLSWINMKAPDSNDYIEFMLEKAVAHVCLMVPDTGAAVKALMAKPYYSTYGRAMEVTTGVNRRRQVNLFDPDGIRVELMEPYTIDGKPAPSSAAPPPH